MKLWLKYVLAVIFGIVFGVVLPLNGGDTEVFFSTFFTYVLHLGRYIVFPLVFFGLAIGTYEMWLEKKFLPVYGRMLLYSLLSAVAASILAVFSVIIFSPERVPIIIEETDVHSLPSLGQQFQTVFPKNLFSIFSNNGDFLLPVFVFAVILGIGFLYNRSMSAPVIEIFQSSSRIFINLNKMLLEILSVGMFFMASYRTVQLRGMADIELFRQLLLVIIGTVLFIVLVIVPLLIYLLGNRSRNPYTWLFATLPVVITAILSGDMYFSIPVAERTLNEDLQVPRRVTSALLPFGSIFSRSGTALVTTMSFILILRSYSSLDISFLQYFWIMGASILLSFMLGSVPGSAMVVSLSIISSWYGQGLEEGFLILLPIAPILTAIAVLIDALVNLVNIRLVTDHEKISESNIPGDFQ